MNDNLESNEWENFAGSIVEILGFIGIIIKSFLNCPDYDVRGSNNFQILEFGKTNTKHNFKVHYDVSKNIAYIKQVKFKLCEIENKLLLPGSGI